MTLVLASPEKNLRRLKMICRDKGKKSKSRVNVIFDLAVGDREKNRPSKF